MPTTSVNFRFVGRGERHELLPHLDAIRPYGGVIGPWRRWSADEGVEDNHAYPDHPANYRASDELVDAVNTAIALGKPLLLTGNPGTGKSQLAERIAWEFNVGPVLRFEAQSLSEANDLFYRFDLVGHLAAVELFKAAVREEHDGQLAAHLRAMPKNPDPERYVKIGPLGEAILRSRPERYATLFDAVFPTENAATAAPRPSVVLIDEIDKASRDFPNDLLNGIERLEFRIRELGLETMTVDPELKPVVIITSNSERDLPPAFLRRCTFFHIADPTEEELERIIAQKFFRGTAGSRGAVDGAALALPVFYRQLLGTFMQFRTQNEDALQYRPGTAEIINWTDALIRRDVSPDAALTDNLDAMKRTASTVSKHKDDHVSLHSFLDGLRPARS
jgi:MoxR-like ATPase